MNADASLIIDEYEDHTLQSNHNDLEFNKAIKGYYKKVARAPPLISHKGKQNNFFVGTNKLKQLHPIHIQRPQSAAMEENK